MRSILMIVMVMAIMIGCGDSNEVSNQNLTYSYEVQGCKTGAKSFSSKRAYCQGLADDRLNNGCAGRLRCQTFKKECGGFDFGIDCIP